jgi:TPR repeat protein
MYGRKLIAAVALCLLAACAGPVTYDKPDLAASLADGLKAYDAGDYKKAHRILEPLAYAGNGTAQVIMGRLYANGFDVPKDRPTALVWYRRAAAANDPEGLNTLGYSYEHSLGVDEDLNEARKLYERAAKAGNLSATNNLGLLYLNGKGVTQDYAEAKRLFEIAAAKSHAPSMNNLGMIYAEGDGVPKDQGKAVKWFQLATEHGDAHAMAALGTRCLDGDGVPKDPVQAYVWFSLAVKRYPDTEPKREAAIKARDAIEKTLTEEDRQKAAKVIEEWRPKPAATAESKPAS